MQVRRGSRTHGKAAFGLFDFERQGLQAFRLAAGIVAEFLGELRADGVDQRLVPVDSAQMQIAAAGDHDDLVLAVADQRKVERAAAQIVNQDALFAGQLREPQPFASQHVAKRGGDRLVDDVDPLQARRVARLHRRVPLHVAELRGDRDHRLRDRPDLLLRRRQQFLENQRRDIDGTIGPAVDPPPLADVPHEPLGILDDAFRMADRVAQRFGSDDRLLPLEQHDRRSGKLPFLVRKRDRLAALVQMGDDRIRRSEVDPDGLCGNHMLSHATIDCNAEREVSEWAIRHEKPSTRSPFFGVGSCAGRVAALRGASGRLARCF